MIKMWHFLSFCCYEENVSMFDISKGIYKQVNLQKYSIKSGLLMRLICNCITSTLQMEFEAIVNGTSNKLYRKNVDTTRTKMVRVHKGIPSGWDGDNISPTIVSSMVIYKNIMPLFVLLNYINLIFQAIANDQ